MINIFGINVQGKWKKDDSVFGYKPLDEQARKVYKQWHLFFEDVVYGED